jgi:hypothetical protein
MTHRSFNLSRAAVSNFFRLPREMDALMTGDWRLSHAAAGNLNGPIHADTTVCVRVLAADASKYVRTANSPRGCLSSPGLTRDRIECLSERT